MNYFIVPISLFLLFTFSAILFIYRKGKFIGLNPATMQEYLDVKTNILRK